MIPLLLWAVFGEIWSVGARIVTGRDGAARTGIAVHATHREC